MTQDVQQWLAEIQSLQQQLIQVSQERATAYEQLSRWQRSYQTEAQQRRKDIRRLQMVIYHLDQENKRLKKQSGLEDSATPPPSQTSNPSQQTPIHHQLKEAIAECDRLSRALSQEQADHEQTRQTLMTALGDTVEQLERERKRHNPSTHPPQLQAAPSNTEMPPAMTSHHAERSITSQQSATPPPLPGPQQKQLVPAPPPYPDADPA